MSLIIKDYHYHKKKGALAFRRMTPQAQDLVKKKRPGNRSFGRQMWAHPVNSDLDYVLIT